MQEGMKLRISLLNVPDNISSLKLRGHLRSQIESICTDFPNDSVLIRAFIPLRALGTNAKKLDTLFSDLVNRIPNLHRIEHVGVNKSLDMKALQFEMNEAQAEMAELHKQIEHDFQYPLQIFGYSDLGCSNPVCMVSNITEANHAEIVKQSSPEFLIGKWFLSITSNADTHASSLIGPYQSHEAALMAAHLQCPSAVIFKDEFGREYVARARM